MDDDRLPDDFFDRIFDALDPEARIVVVLRFGLDRGHPRSSDDVAVALGWDRSRVVAVLRRAMDQIPPGLGL